MRRGDNHGSSAHVHSRIVLLFTFQEAPSTPPSPAGLLLLLLLLLLPTSPTPAATARLLLLLLLLLASAGPATLLCKIEMDEM
jgi:hypothetical protein